MTSRFSEQGQNFLRWDEMKNLKIQIHAYKAHFLLDRTGRSEL